MEQSTLKTLEWDKIKLELQEYCASDLGKERASKIVPLSDINKIKFLLKKTSNSIELIRKYSFPPLFGIYELKSMMNRLSKNAVLENIEFIQIADSLRVSKALKEYISEYDGEDNEIVQQIENLYTNSRIQKEIERIFIDEDNIADDASKTLLSIRKSIRQKMDEVRAKLKSIVSSQSDFNLQENFITMRDGRYVVPVKVGAKSKFPGITHDISSSGQTLYIEPMAVVEINNKIRDLEIAEYEEIRKILKELSEMIYLYREDIEKNQFILIDLDFSFAKAKYALDRNFNKPIVNDEKIINIKNAKHPLLKGKVVPIDVEIGENFTALVITGPNTGGKTVSLKTVGLLVIMAQAGLFIPAEENSKIAIFKDIYADIGDNQSIEQSLSTFSASMINIINILKKANDKSLVLFDELGNGTDPTEGAALAMSIIDDLVKRKTILISTTHYSELKIYAMTTQGVQNANVEFDIKTLSPTYKLRIGTPGKSNAFEISKKLGLNSDILINASKYLSKENKDFEEVISEIESDRIRLEKELKELRIEKNKYKQLIEKESFSIERRKEKAEIEIEESKEKAKQILEEARKEAKEILKFAKSQRGANIRDLDRVQSQITDRVKNVSNRYKTKGFEFPKSNEIIDVKLGETVKVLSTGDLAVVQSLPDNRGNLIVQMGIIKFNVNIKDLTKTRENVEQNISKSSVRSVLHKKSLMDAKQEIDIRGFNVEEARVELDIYFDTSTLQGLKQVFVIHGKGTGALREGLQDYFKKSRYVDKYREGTIHEGGAGVTVVTLK